MPIICAYHHTFGYKMNPLVQDNAKRNLRSTDQTFCETLGSGSGQSSIGKKGNTMPQTHDSPSQGEVLSFLGLEVD